MLENPCSQCQKCVEPCIIIPTDKAYKEKERTSITEYSTEELKQLHFELWNYLANNPTKSKSNWYKFKELPKDIEDYFWCFACVEAGNDEGYILKCSYCENCPLRVPTELQEVHGICICNDTKEDTTNKIYSIYNLWGIEYEDTNETIKYAKIIRDSWK